MRGLRPDTDTKGPISGDSCDARGEPPIGSALVSFGFSLCSRRPPLDAPFRSGMQLALCLRPKPAKRACRQQAVDQTINDVLESDTPGLALPNRVLNQRERVAGERDRACNAKDF